MRKRRSALAVAAVLGCAAMLSGCAREKLAACDEYGIFGTQVRWVYAQSEGADAPTVWEEVVAALRTVERQTSSSIEESTVARFNAAPAGSRVAADEAALGVIGTARAVYEETFGAYDPALGRLIDLWGFSPRHRTGGGSEAYDRADARTQLPAAEYLAAFAAADMTDFSAVGEEDGEAGRVLVKPAAAACVAGETYGMQLSLDGIAKGAGVDAAVQIVRAAGYTYGYLNAGGSSLYVLRDPSREDGLWEISVNSPREELGASYATLIVRDTSVSTSGDHEQYYEIDGVRYCHIIRPDTGLPVGVAQNGGTMSAVSHIVCATVVGGTAAEGDARATAIVTMSLSEACAYAAAHADAFRVMFVWYDVETDAYALYTNLPQTAYRVTAAFDAVEVIS